MVRAAIHSPNTVIKRALDKHFTEDVCTGRPTLMSPEGNVREDEPCKKPRPYDIARFWMLKESEPLKYASDELRSKCAWVFELPSP